MNRYSGFQFKESAITDDYVSVQFVLKQTLALMAKVSEVRKGASYAPTSEAMQEYLDTLEDCLGDFLNPNLDELEEALEMGRAAHERGMRR
jgi:hypothetical protein